MASHVGLDMDPPPRQAYAQHESRTFGVTDEVSPVDSWRQRQTSGQGHDDWQFRNGRSDAKRREADRKNDLAVILTVFVLVIVGVIVFVKELKDRTDDGDL